MNLHVMGGDKNPINKEDESYRFPRATSFCKFKKMHKQTRTTTHFLCFCYSKKKTHLTRTMSYLKKIKYLVTNFKMMCFPK